MIVSLYPVSTSNDLIVARQTAVLIYLNSVLSVTSDASHTPCTILFNLFAVKILLKVSFILVALSSGFVIDSEEKAMRKVTHL